MKPIQVLNFITGLFYISFIWGALGFNPITWQYWALIGFQILFTIVGLI